MSMTTNISKATSISKAIISKAKIYKVSHYSSFINTEKYHLEFKNLENNINLKIGVLNV